MVENVIPYIGGEEEKSEMEPMKIWGHIEDGVIKAADSPVITCQCVRVPVLDGPYGGSICEIQKEAYKRRTDRSAGSL